MGNVIHSGVIVTCWNLEMLQEARTMASYFLTRTKNYANLVTEISEYGINMGGSFAILPCGSNAGRDEDEYFRNALTEFTTWLDKEFISGLNCCLYAQMEFTRDADRYSKIYASNVEVTTQEERDDA